ncbi:rhomboid family intramembrane serine protease [Streptomonospora wellingtoniae]|uniref:Rhomboid family intramembrane serine protease n=1 Tax=Streptomonospora wellingtoniae TaxID=3075544 RepID=A0ABU2KP62_9ACTN|nr:rhomboid family intramembrane serine protease [Streptomonospora sp. DSM 45055]MDT0301056.1 rhomboid family intramembrane serine protease [Streptomonospora sp. DSM 45055]
MAGIPLSDDYPVRRVPTVTYALVAVNVAAYLLSPLSLLAVWYDAGDLPRQCAVEHYFLRWAAVPVELLGGPQVEGSGPCPAPGHTKVAWISALTSMFMHGGALHLIGNMVYLFVFGPVVEDRLGRLRYLGLYVGSGLVATYAFALTQASAEVPLVGASGAISGVLGAYLLVQHRSRVVTLVLVFVPVRLPGWALVGTYFILQYFLYVSMSAYPGSDAGVAYAAHVYGFIAGALGALLMHRIRWRSGIRRSDVY